MDKTRIAFIGGGNMARALIEGLIDTDAYDLRVADPGQQARETMTALGGIAVFADNAAAIEDADCIVFAVKPQILKGVCTALSPQMQNSRALAISIAAGIQNQHLSKWLGGYHRLVRAMPNTPALIGAGATGLVAAAGASAQDRELATAIFESVGLAIWVAREPLIDAVTCLSGSGPAYFFYLLEALESTAIGMGLEPGDARRLARQTALGAALMALREEGDLATLRERVTSPGGTTQAALEIMHNNGLPSIVESALQASARRAGELASEFGR